MIDEYDDRLFARTAATAKHKCFGCYDRSYNGHPAKPPRDTQPLRCIKCPIHAIMLAAGIPLDPKKVNPYSGAYIADGPA